MSRENYLQIITDWTVVFLRRGPPLLACGAPCPLSSLLQTALSQYYWPQRAPVPLSSMWIHLVATADIYLPCFRCNYLRTDAPRRDARNSSCFFFYFWVFLRVIRMGRKTKSVLNVFNGLMCFKGCLWTVLYVDMLLASSTLYANFPTEAGGRWKYLLKKLR